LGGSPRPGKAFFIANKSIVPDVGSIGVGGISLITYKNSETPARVFYLNRLPGMPDLSGMYGEAGGASEKVLLFLKLRPGGAGEPASPCPFGVISLQKRKGKTRHPSKKRK
jgi:hypothetical protein